MSLSQEALRGRRRLPVPLFLFIGSVALYIGAALVTTPFNVPEAVVITGPLQYIERIPIVGVPSERP